MKKETQYQARKLKTVYIPRELHHDLKLISVQQDRSITDVVTEAIERGLEKETTHPPSG